MKKLMFLFSALMLTASVSMAGNPYEVDDQAVNAMFENATEVSIMDVDANNTMDVAGITETQAASAGGALIRCWLFGSLGWHRAYLNGEGFLFPKYCWTLGGCGMLSGIDWWLLVFKVIGDGDVSKFENNNGWFMWGD